MRVNARSSAMSLFVSGSSFLHHQSACKAASKKSDLGMSVATTNPLIVKGQLPAFDRIVPTDILPAVKEDLQTLKSSFEALQAKLKDTSKADYGMIVEEMEKMQAPLSFSWGVTGHLMGVKNGDDLRKAHDDIQPSVIETYQALGQSKPIYQALKALKEDQTAWNKLEAAQQRIVESSLRGMQHSGVGLLDNQRESFNKLQLELAELSTKFSNNVLDSTKAFKLRITDVKEVEGLPSSALALAAQRAQTEGDKEATPTAGPWIITLDMPSYLPAMQHLKV